MTTPANKRLRRSFLILVTIGLVMNAAVLLFGARALNTTRNDFCVFAASIVTAAHQLPQAPGRVHAEDAYVHLQQQLGCPQEAP